MTNLIAVPIAVLITNQVEQFEPVYGSVGCPDSMPGCLVYHQGVVGSNKDIKLLTTTITERRTLTLPDGSVLSGERVMTNWTVRYKKVESWAVDTNNPPKTNLSTNWFR